ncbi:hypothetical protein D9M71_654270 [compost metagenome]
MHHQAGVEQAVLGKAAVTRQRLVVGDAAAQRQIDAFAGCDYYAGAIHARDRALLPGRVAPLADFPVHRVEGNGAVGHQHFAGAGLWQGFAQQLQAVEAGVRGPGPGLMVGWHGAGPCETGVGGRLAGIGREKQVCCGQGVLTGGQQTEGLHDVAGTLWERVYPRMRRYIHRRIRG